MFIYIYIYNSIPVTSYIRYMLINIIHIILYINSVSLLLFSYCKTVLNIKIGYCIIFISFKLKVTWPVRERCYDSTKLLLYKVSREVELEIFFIKKQNFVKVTKNARICQMSYINQI